MTIIFLRIGWMEHYRGLDGDAIDGGGDFVKKRRYGGEIFNFQPFNGSVYGYVHPPRLLSHHTNPSPDLTFDQELVDSEYDESEAVDLVLEAGRISLHGVLLAHGSEANRSPHLGRGMTLRYMPTTAVFDRDMARRPAGSPTRRESWTTPSAPCS